MAEPLSSTQLIKGELIKEYGDKVKIVSPVKLQQLKTHQKPGLV
ncbi:MAG: hypothetical protein OEW99_01915 [Gammaproteobacteria bacterium]|nr:hypothetical protein [Gammaproteobacteria bacterium]MDH5660666.1 hypothetical protein [Gammaproteobacteria bacterium]